MVQVTSDQWLHWLSLYFWPLLRVLALISTAPILSERTVPKRVKLGLGIVITLIIAPTLPTNDTPLFSIAALWLALEQILIGIALGFTMQFAFAAVRTAGELIGLQMGLSFATFLDPGSNLNMPVLARLMDMLAMLLFLTFNGHLWLISMLVDTFHTLPIGGEPINSNAFLALARAGGLIFLNGVMLALPVMTLLLTLNLALGMLNRMAPQLSVFVIGFPLTLSVGILLMSVLMPLIAPFCEHLFSEIFNLLADIISELPKITPP
ncbi:flagellar biosynthetic protein FliR [Superficieibacter sp.]|uniref:flagellar biosynthetic protein FliR n=1 Tax=Superficieibacter sp. TaxID=2303322 RepID=UPI0028ADD0B5|nr:flagellar biosynthetic protein FliR [Superficieibacter sp.]